MYKETKAARFLLFTFSHRTRLLAFAVFLLKVLKTRFHQRQNQAINSVTCILNILLTVLTLWWVTGLIFSTSQVVFLTAIITFIFTQFKYMISYFHTHIYSSLTRLLQTHKLPAPCWLTGTSTSRTIFFRLYSHHGSSSVHNCENHLHIHSSHFLNQ